MRPIANEHGEVRRRERHRAVDQPRVEVHVRVELAADEVVVVERRLLELERDLEVLVHPDLREHLVGELLHDAARGS
jgi:hypothetical protein